MPDSPEVDLKKVEHDAEEKINAFGGEVGKVEQEPVAFGLVALKIMFAMNESKGDTESLEKDISSIEGIQSVEVVSVTRAMG